MSPFSRWLADRRHRDEQAVVNAIRMLRPSQSSSFPISRLAGVGVGRAYAALIRLERAGLVESAWSDGPYPRRRLYRLVRSEVAR